MNTNSPVHIAERARSILNAWFYMTEDEESWKTMTVTQLHDICDPNAAFDEAARGSAHLVNAAMDAYNDNYAVVDRHERYFTTPAVIGQTVAGISIGPGYRTE